MKDVWNSPFVVLPLAAIFLGLAIVPFAVWNVDHAAQFYGSFFAAIIAAGAAYSGYFIQNRLSVAKEEKAAKAKHLSEIVDLFFRLRFIQVQLMRANRILDRKLGQTQQPPNDTTPFFPLLDIERNRITLAEITNDLRLHATKALGLPAKVRVVVAGRIYDICEVAEILRNTVSPVQLLTKKNVQSLKGTITKQIKFFDSSANHVREYLKANGAMGEDSAET
jgi:hypothetical protein